MKIQRKRRRVSMFVLEGKYNAAKVFTDNIDSKTMAQIIEICNQEFTKNSKIRIMPDTHLGAGGPIGLSMTIKDKVVPNLVGVDIGCGMEVVQIKEKELDLQRLDEIIHEHIPSGFDIRKNEHEYANKIAFSSLKCRDKISIERARLSVGTTGGGNHFIEGNKDSKGNIYLVVHSGSRHLGKQVAEYYQDLAWKQLSNMKAEKQELINRLKAEGREKEIQNELKKLQPTTKIKKDLAYLESEHLEDYLHDMRIVQGYAVYNRQAIIDEIVERMGITVVDQFTTIHNYIDLDNMILRKGAVSAQKGERIIIPINMRDGSIIAIGKGNEDWNYSAPHGAGRLFSRSESKKHITLEQFKKSMEGIYSSSVNESTIDESPMAYKPIEEIMENIKETVEIIDVIRPIYNFKAS
jgi:tRNA-splicing ligase RtcB